MRVTPAVLDATARFDDLYRREWRSLLRLAVLLVDERALAEEIVQDAFLGLFRRWSDIEDDRRAAAYVRTSVVNGARSALRRRWVSRGFPGWHEEDADGADVPAVASDENRRMLQAVRRLPRRQREVVLLRYWSDLSEADIAATLGVSVGTVKTSASRALATLERLVQEGRS